MGRHKKKESNPAEAMEQLLQQAVYLYGVPYDDRIGRKNDLPSIRSVADEMDTTILRVRKLLITAGYYSTEISRNIQELQKSGLTMKQIMEETNLSRASVYSYIPFHDLAFNLDQTTANADRLKLFRRRKKAIIELNDHLNGPGMDEYLWKAIIAFEKYPFFTMKRFKFDYEIKRGRNNLPTGEIVIDRKEKTITRSTINLALHKALEIQKKDGSVSGPKRIGGFGASYLYPIFLRFKLIKKAPED